MDDRRIEEERPSVSFWLIVGAAALYLGLRLVQGVLWVIQQVG